MYTYMYMYIYVQGLEGDLGLLEQLLLSHAPLLLLLTTREKHELEKNAGGGSKTACERIRLTTHGGERRSFCC